MAPKQHLFDELATDLAQWIEDTADALADAMSDGGQVPFAAVVPQAQKVEYFREQLYLPDGSLNQPGRADLLARYGPDGYAGIVRTVLKSMGGLPPIPPISV
jgi:hypothetical protein